MSPSTAAEAARRRTFAIISHPDAGPRFDLLDTLVRLRSKTLLA
jgi:peptide subunit release factor RF-3